MTYFYGRLFASDPEIRAMFPATMAAQRRRIYAALCRVAAGRHRAGSHGAGPELDGYLAALGRAHRKFGVRAEHYEAFREALEATFRRYPPEAVRWTELERSASFSHAADVMISAAGADTGPAWWPAEVISREPRSPRVTVLTLRTGQPLPCLPGQHIAVQAPRWPRVWRRYSVANAPRSAGDHADGGPLTLHVSVVPGGLVSTALRHAAPGDTLVLGPAEGTMTADLTSGRDVLCLAGGTGLAPVKAIIEALLAAGGGSGEGAPGEDGSGAGTARGPRITLYFGARTQADLYDLPALRAMERARPRLEVLPATSDERSPHALYGTIADLAPDACWQGRDVYISGPDDMIISTVRGLRGRGAPAERLHYDLSPGPPFPAQSLPGQRAAEFRVEPRHRVTQCARVGAGGPLKKRRRCRTGERPRAAPVLPAGCGRWRRGWRGRAGRSR